MPPRIVAADGLSNAAFLERHAGPGRVGLAGGSAWVDRRIRRSERRVTPDGAWSRWSHAFVFEGRRHDGAHWVVEADVDLARGQFRNGVQENRADKFHDAQKYPALAVLDFGLSPARARALVGRALDFVAERVRYSYGGLVGTWLAMRRRSLDRRSRLHGGAGLFCSSFVQLLYLEEGLRFAPDVAPENVTPEHIAQSAAARAIYRLER